MHAKRVLSLTSGVVGVTHAAALGVHAIGLGLADAIGLEAKHAIKQVDRLLSNRGIDVWEEFAVWVPFVIGQREQVLVALDWTDFDKDDQTTLAMHLVSNHGRATPLVWMTVRKSTLTDKRNEYEDKLLRRFSEVVPQNVEAIVLADRGFGDQARYEFIEGLGLKFIIRFREGIAVTPPGEEPRPAGELVPKNGRAVLLKNVDVTKGRTSVPGVVLVKAKKMKSPWCLATNVSDMTAREIVNAYGRRFTIEESFRDAKDPRFGFGLSASRISKPERRDRVFFLSAIATVLALQPEDVARIRALDWHNPTMSDFRCGLYENAVERFRKGLPEGVESGEDTRTLHLMRDLFPHILTVHPGDFGIALEEPVSLTASEADHFIAFASADDASIEDLVRAVADGSVASSACGAQGVGMCEVTLPEMGAMIEDRFKAVEAGGRDFLNARRNTLACKAVDHYESVPHIPGTDCENPQPEPDPAPEDPEPEGGTTGGPDEGTSGGPEGGTTGGPEGGTTGGMGADAGNCCEPRDAEVGCEQSDVQACVCAEDSFCCETAWDQQCVDLVDSLGCTPGC